MRKLSQRKRKKELEPTGIKETIHNGRQLYIAIMAATIVFVTKETAYAAIDIWDKANEIMKDIYGEIILISTLVAIVTASVALLLMNFSKSGKTVDESRTWLHRIAITWVILNSLGFIMAYITPFFADGRWNG